MSESLFRQRRHRLPPSDEEPPAWMQALLPVAPDESLDDEGPVHALQVWPVPCQREVEAARLVVVARPSKGTDPLVI